MEAKPEVRRVSGALLVSIALHASVLLWSLQAGSRWLAERSVEAALEIRLADPSRTSGPSELPAPPDPELQARDAVPVLELPLVSMRWEDPAEELFVVEAALALEFTPGERSTPAEAPRSAHVFRGKRVPRAVAGSGQGGESRSASPGFGSSSGASASEAGAASALAATAGPAGQAPPLHGGRASPVVTAAAPLQTAPPEYPRSSRCAGEEGSVLCQLSISEAGLVTAVVVLESSGHERLDEAAQATLRTWRFRPKTEDGRPVASLLEHRITFVLQG
jgi:protein TonB